jgi:antitoxin component of MazEF toxin-antitoxin module
MVKVQKLPSGQLVITIPKILAEYEGLTKGAEVEFKKHKDGFLLKIKKVGVNR